MYFFTYWVDFYSKYLSFQNIISILLADAMELQKMLSFFHPFVVRTIIPKAFAHSILLKISKQSTVWQNVDGEVFLMFIEYTESAAINKRKRLIKYLNTLNRTAKRRGLSKVHQPFHRINVPRWTYGTTFYFSSRGNDSHKFRSWRNNSMNL